MAYLPFDYWSWTDEERAEFKARMDSEVATAVEFRKLAVKCLESE